MMQASKEIQRRSLSARVADTIRKMILTGEVSQGDQLRQEQIANQLGVSRIPVREALQLLEAEGLITNLPYKGAVVTTLSENEIREYFDIRGVLEAELVKEAVAQMSDENLQKARAIHEKMKTAPPSLWGELNWDFHAALCASANKSITLDYIKKIHDNLDRYVRIQLSISQDNLDHAHREHELLLRLCEEGKKTEAAKLVRSHVAKARDDLLLHLKDHP